MLQVGYVGNKGVELPNRYDANQAPQFDPANPMDVQAKRPYQRVGSVSANTSWTSSNYDGLDLRLERRFAGGLSLFATFIRMNQIGIRSHENYPVMPIDTIRPTTAPTACRTGRSSAECMNTHSNRAGRSEGVCEEVSGRSMAGWQLDCRGPKCHWGSGWGVRHHRPRPRDPPSARINKDFVTPYELG